jgi:hypothetical protein
MTKSLTASVLLLAASMLFPSLAEARQSHGRGGGGHVSFAARAPSAASFRASAPRFVAAAPQRFSAPRVYAGAPVRAHDHRRFRGYGPGYGYVAAIGVPLVSYAYYNTTYRSCAWLKARYEDTGLRKWRLRYEACLDGDDD